MNATLVKGPELIQARIDSAGGDLAILNKAGVRRVHPHTQLVIAQHRAIVLARSRGRIADHAAVATWGPSGWDLTCACGAFESHRPLLSQVGDEWAQHHNEAVGDPT